MQKGDDQEMEEVGKEGEEGDVERIKVGYVCAPNPHEECNRFVPQRCTNTNKNLTKKS